MTLPQQIPYPPEVAVIVVGGKPFYNWESVYVQMHAGEAWPIFRFHSTEYFPPSTFPLIQLRPGMSANIYLGGQLACAGVIVIRQTAYEAEQHQIQLTGYGVTWLAARASHLDETGNFDNMGFEQIAQRLLTPFRADGVWYTVVGQINNEPFVHEQIQPGETIWDFLEGLARRRGIQMGHDEKGNFVFYGPEVKAPTDSLIEGVNIKKCVGILSAENLYSEYDLRGQTPSSDDNAGSGSSQVTGHAVGQYLPMYSPQLTPAGDIVRNQAEADERAKYEQTWHDYTYVSATVTVQGWLRSNGQLWHAGDTVHVKSPMALIDSDLAIKTVTFTQDSQTGTLTTLDLVDPRLLLINSIYNTSSALMPTPGTTPAQPYSPGVDSPAPPPPSFHLPALIPPGG